MMMVGWLLGLGGPRIGMFRREGGGRMGFLQGKRRRVHAAQKRRKGDSLGTVEGWVCARYQDVTVCESVCLFVIDLVRWAGWWG